MRLQHFRVQSASSLSSLSPVLQWPDPAATRSQIRLLSSSRQNQNTRRFCNYSLVATVCGILILAVLWEKRKNPWKIPLCGCLQMLIKSSRWVRSQPRFYLETQIKNSFFFFKTLFSSLFPSFFSSFFPPNLCSHLLEVLKTATAILFFLIKVFCQRPPSKNKSLGIYFHLFPAGNPRRAIKAGQKAVWRQGQWGGVDQAGAQAPRQHERTSWDSFQETDCKQ